MLSVSFTDTEGGVCPLSHCRWFLIISSVVDGHVLCALVLLSQSQKFCFDLCISFPIKFAFAYSQVRGGCDLIQLKEAWHLRSYLSSNEGGMVSEHHVQ